MSNLYLRLAFIPLALFTAILFLIRIQPYDDHELRQLLLPDGCPAPCFMGIRPGVTTMEEAFAILKSNQWVGEIRQRTGSIEWTWSDASPRIVDQRYSAYVQHSNMPPEQCCVGSLKFNSQFTLGDLYLLLGRPTRTNLVRGPTSAYALVSISYLDQKMRLFTRVNCPLSKLQFWQTRSETYIESNLLYNQEGGLSANIIC